MVRKNISIGVNTWNDLAALGRFGQTFDDIIRILLAEHEELKKIKGKGYSFPSPSASPSPSSPTSTIPAEEEQYQFARELLEQLKSGKFQKHYLDSSRTLETFTRKLANERKIKYADASQLIFNDKILSQELSRLLGPNAEYGLKLLRFEATIGFGGPAEREAEAKAKEKQQQKMA